MGHAARGIWKLSKSRHLYFVQSPLQAVNAYEARHAIADGVGAHDLVVLDQKEERNNFLLANTLKALGWEPMCRVPFRRSDPLKMLEWLRLRARLSGLRGVSRCYIGDYCSGMGVAAANLFPKAEAYVLDDGTSTINFPGLRYEARRPQHLPPNRNFPLMGYRTDLPESLTLFSMYEVEVRPPDSLRANKLSFLTDSLRFDSAGPVFFIGSCLPDVEVISFQQFFDLFRAARQWLGDREIVYFPHRRELLDLKRDFFRQLGVRLAHTELPFELEIARGLLKPSLVATFYSTALDTLRIICQGKKRGLLAFHVPEHWIQTEAHLEIARKSYAEYRMSQEVEIVDLGSLMAVGR